MEPAGLPPRCFSAGWGAKLIHMNATPDGQFPHEPEPTAKNLTSLCDEVRRQKAFVGFAQDPDADRLAIVDENGDIYRRRIFVGSGREMDHVTQERSGRGCRIYRAAACSMTSPPLHGGRVLRTPVGEANVNRLHASKWRRDWRRGQRRRNRPPDSSRGATAWWASRMFCNWRRLRVNRLPNWWPKFRAMRL